MVFLFRSESCRSSQTDYIKKSPLGLFFNAADGQAVALGEPVRRSHTRIGG